MCRYPRTVTDLARLGFIDKADVLSLEVRRQQYAYVIYDLDHRANMGIVRDYCEQQLGIILHGRFGEFAYLNMDDVIHRSLQRCEAIAARGPNG